MCVNAEGCREGEASAQAAMGSTCGPLTTGLQAVWFPSTGTHTVVSDLRNSPAPVELRRRGKLGENRTAVSATARATLPTKCQDLAPGKARCPRRAPLEVTPV